MLDRLKQRSDTGHSVVDSGDPATQPADAALQGAARAAILNIDRHEPWHVTGAIASSGAGLDEQRERHNAAVLAGAEAPGGTRVLVPSPGFAVALYAEKDYPDGMDGRNIVERLGGPKRVLVRCSYLYMSGDGFLHKVKGTTVAHFYGEGDKDLRCHDVEYEAAWRNLGGDPRQVYEPVRVLNFRAAGSGVPELEALAQARPVRKP